MAALYLFIHEHNNTAYMTESLLVNVNENQINMGKHYLAKKLLE